MTRMKKFLRKIYRKICALIPRRVSNTTVVSAFEWMRRTQKLKRKRFTGNLEKNRAAYGQHIASLAAANGYVEDQNRWGNMAYGKSTMQHSGCEVFAAFNALRSLTGECPIHLPDMIDAFEKDGIVFSGRFGTAPKAVEDFLKRYDYKTVFTANEKEFDRVGRENDSLILTLYNDSNDIRQEVHTVNISKESGKYTAHNAACNGRVVGPCASVSEVIRSINGGRAKGISLIGIKNKTE